MSLSEEERKAIVNLEIEKAENTFAQVSKLTELGYWDTIANRLYYSAFHAATALLINDGYRVNTHKGIIALLDNIMSGQTKCHLLTVSCTLTSNL